MRSVEGLDEDARVALVQRAKHTHPLREVLLQEGAQLSVGTHPVRSTSHYITLWYDMNWRGVTLHHIAVHFIALHLTLIQFVSCASPLL